MFGEIWQGIDPNEEPPNLLKDGFPFFLGRKPMDKDLGGTLMFRDKRQIVVRK